jgi:hypothetical protein
MKRFVSKDVDKEIQTYKLEDNIFLRVIDYGLEYPDGFTYDQLVRDLKLEGWELETVKEHFYIASRNYENVRGLHESANTETLFFVIKRGGSVFTDDNWKYIISFDANFKFIDYHELKFARENAKEAKRLAVIAIAVSVGAALTSIVMPVLVAQWFTQTVKLDSSQLQDLKSALVCTTTKTISNP